MPHEHSIASCPLHRLAESSLGKVEICADCGSVHLTLQSLTVRLEPKAFMELVGMALQARHRLLQIARSSECPAEAVH